MAVGYTWHADEIYFKVREQPRWMFGVMDAETKLIIAHDTAQDKIGYDATGLFEDAIKAAGKRPDVLITDGLAGFKKGYTKAMYTRTMPRTIHVADVGIRDRHPANNAYERFNGEIRDRIALGTRVQVQGSGTTWPAYNIPQLHAPARGPGRQDSCRGCRNHDIRS